MAAILLLETATSVCSVALAKDGEILAMQADHAGKNHARLLVPIIEEVLRKSRLLPFQLDAIALSEGPGSFTGLRIGGATAKGMCYALDKPLIAVNTLQSMANLYVMMHKPPRVVNLCPMIDARRMEVYTAVFNYKAEFQKDTFATSLDEGFFSTYSGNTELHFFGDGALKGKAESEKYMNTRFVPDFFPSAQGMVTFAEKAYKSAAFKDVSAFEPFYLKDFYSPRQPF